MKVPITEMLPYAAGGVGLALLENKLLGNNLPDPLKKVNLGVGGLTGALVADPATRAGALSSLPFKQLGLFGISSLDKFRQQQQNLVDTNLQTAQINRQTARTQGRDAGGRKALMAAFLVPALAGGGAMAYGAYQQHKKHKANRYGTIASKGNPPAHQKIRMDIPPSAFPKDFFKSLADLSENPKTYTRLEEQPNGDELDKPPVLRGSSRMAKLHARRPDLAVRSKVAGWYKRAYASEQPAPSTGILPTVGRMAYEATGIPSFQRALSEGGKSRIDLEQGDHSNALRYGLAGLANAGIGYAALRTGVLPVLGRLLGKGRLGGVIERGAGGFMRGGLGRQLTEMPTLAKPIFNATFGNELSPRLDSMGNVIETAAQRMAKRKAKGLSTTGPMDRLLNIKGRYDPNYLSWDNPNSPWWSPSNPAMRSSPPPASLPGQLWNVGKYGVNRALNAGYWTKQLARRWPNVALSLAGMPFASMGVVQDQNQMDEARRSLQGAVPDYLRNRGPYGMPISSALSGLMSGFGGYNVQQPITDQMSSQPHNPFGLQRMAGLLL